MHVCRSWRTIVQQSPEFWTNIQARSCTSIAYIKGALEYSATRLLTLRVDITGPLYGDPPHDADALLTLLRGHMHRVKYITVIVGLTSATEENTRQLLLKRLPALRTFYLVRAGKTMPRHSAPRLFTWAGGHTTISSLRLHHTSLIWTTMSRFASLTVLVIRDLAVEFSPTWADYRLLFQTAGLLKKLCI
ncbi:hypothetical protein B0H16DRAFT_1732297 [Mycena metata]|uniref:F-box domain-containing protein n=1 Tax=Mycena metata TaxID=1033252 RepID=A0AAD7I395_9AGAR|nr:hypothetical protein B0H16DRAFT_1732297 [Mycena metata]